MPRVSGSRSHNMNSFGWLPSLRRTSLALAFIGSLLLVQIAVAQTPVSQLTSVFPAGGKQGANVEVTVAGTDLDEAEKIVFSHPGITATPKMTPPDEFSKAPKPVVNVFTVTIAGNVPQGIYEARVVSRFGVSNPRSFAVGTVDELVKVAGNSLFEKAMELAIGPILNARADANGRDFYKFNLSAGQRVLIECWAKRIDSKMDPSFTLFSGDGKELTRFRDADFDDAALDFTAPAAGTYVVAVNDFVFGGGADYFYRLSIHTRPKVDFVLPPSGVTGSNSKYTIYGHNLPGSQPAPDMKLGPNALQKLEVQIAIPTDINAVRAPMFDSSAPRIVTADSIEYRFNGADPVPLYISKAPAVIAEVEPNNDAKKAQKVSVPCEFVGQFYPSRDADWLQFDAKKGDVLAIEVLSHRLGISSDPFLLLQKVLKNDKGEEVVSDVASMDDPADRNTKIGTDFDTTTDDPNYRFTAPDNATYRLMVRDQFGTGRSDPRMIYRIAIRKLQPDFRLVAVGQSTDAATGGKANAQQAAVTLGAPVIRRGGTALIQVSADRLDDFKGDIQVSIEGLPAGVTCSGVTMPPETNTATLILVAADNAAAWTGPIQIVGKAQIDGKELSHPARFGTVLWGTANRQNQSPAFRVARDLAIGVNEKEMVIASVQPNENKIIETSIGADLTIPIKVTRRADFKDALKLAAIGLPTEIKATELNIEGKDATGQLKVPLTAANVKPGLYSFYLKSDAKIKYVRNPELQKKAEEEQAFVADMLKQLEQKVKDATTAKETATKAKETPEALAKADANLKEAQKKLDAAKKAKTDADKKVADAKTAMAPKDATFSVVSSPITIRVAASPMKLTADVPATTIKQGDKAEVGLKLERLYGFADGAEITLEAPKGVAGLSSTKLTIDKSKADGKLEIKVEKNAPVGEHTATIRAKGKFNNVNVETTSTVVVKVEATPPAAK